MITQQVASYLIKKMEAATKGSSKQVGDETDKLFKTYLSSKGSKTAADVIKNGDIDNDAIVGSFRWRAAELSYQAYEARIVNKRSWNSLLIQLHMLSNGKCSIFKSCC